MICVDHERSPIRSHNKEESLDRVLNDFGK
jgi:hypothetical protein